MPQAQKDLSVVIEAIDGTRGESGEGEEGCEVGEGEEGLEEAGSGGGEGTH